MGRIAFGLLSIISFLLLSCRKDEPCLSCPAPYQQHVFLDTLIVDATETWLRLYTNDSTSAGSIQLYRDSISLLHSTILSRDTTLIDSGLAPASFHSYKAYRLQNGIRIDSTRLVILKTMDTSSHEFSWRIDSLGDGNGSFLKDIAIINDTDVWAVGYMYKKDSSGNFEPDPYSVAQWNGATWRLIRVDFPICDYNGNEVGTAYFNCTSVYAFGNNDVWLTSGGNFAHWNGTSFQRMCLPSGVIQGELIKIWGTSSNNLYAVGRNGTIIHFNGSAWQKMESGTDVDLLDVWGSPDGSVVWACGWIDFKPTVLLRCSSGQWEKAFEDPFPFILRTDSLSGILSSVWTSKSERVIVGGNYGPYKAISETKGAAERFSFAAQDLPGFPNRLRGHSSNDLVIVGYYNMIAHYNGANWRYYAQFYQPDQHLFSVDVKGDLFVAVGEVYDPINRKGLVFMGRR